MREAGPLRPEFDLRPDPVEAPGLRLSPLPPARMQLCSGPGLLARLAAEGVRLIGWPDVAGEGRHALVLRRDQAAVMGGEAMAEGWRPELGCAVTDVTDGWIGLRAEGAAAADLLARGAELRLDRPSASVARPLFGMPALVHRHGSETVFHLHLRRAEFPAAWARLAVEAARIGDGI